MREFDVVVIGGGTAGLSAALALGRSRRRTLVCGSGEPRNAPSHEVHSFFTRDGASPTELLRMGRDQLAPYESVEFKAEQVVHAFRRDIGFEVVLQDGTRVGARKLLLATGMKDELPPIEGLQAMWGVSALHCPYCHGWEVRDQPIALYGNGEIGFALCVLLTGWSRDLVLCTDGPSNLTDEQQRLLDKNNILVYQERISRFEETKGQLQKVVFEGGEELSRQALFIRPPQKQRCDVANTLGSEVEDELVKVDDSGETSVQGVYAAGDITTRWQQLSYAAYSGSRAAGSINHTLLMEDFG